MSVLPSLRQQGSLLLLAVLLLLALGVLLVSGQHRVQEARWRVIQYRQQTVITRHWVASTLSWALHQPWEVTGESEYCRRLAENLTLCVIRLSTQYAMMCVSGQRFVLGPRIRHFRYGRLKPRTEGERAFFLDPFPAGWLDYPPNGYQGGCL